MKCLKENRGITLITLAVTIVVILILAGVTLDVTIGENGILNKSKEAANRMNNLVKEDESELNELLNELNETMDSNWNSNIEIPEGNNEEGGGNTETGGENIGDLVDNGTIEIGDYIAYNPTGDASYTVDGTYSGTGMDQTIQKESLNWRVLDKTQAGNVRLISAEPTVATVKLQGADGYNNAVYLLDELCNTLYKGENATAQNLKIEDIQNKMNLSVWNYNNYLNYGSTFWPTEKKYPMLLAKELRHTINGATGNLNLSEQLNLIQGIGEANSLTVIQTYWQYSMKTDNYINNIYYELFHTTKKYWLSSRCIDMEGEIIRFNARVVNQNIIGGATVYASNGYISTNVNTYSVNPIIYLNFNVQIDTSIEGKDGKTPGTAYIIK